MRINGREIGLLYTIGAFCDYNDYLVANPEVSIARANMQKAVIMSKAYCEVNGGEPLTLEEVKKLPVYVIDELFPAIQAAEKAGTERTVETQEKKDQGKKEAKK